MQLPFQEFTYEDDLPKIVDKLNEMRRILEHGINLGNLDKKNVNAEIRNTVNNFNSRNDRVSTTITLPTVATDGTAIVHTISTDGSANISLKWNWTGNNADIDGWIVYAHQSTASTAYTIGDLPAEELTYNIPNDKRAFIFYGVPADRYYTFGVQAYRYVDQDIATIGLVKSAIVQPSRVGDNPYRPASGVAYTGDIAGTVNGIAASTLTTQAANGNTAFNGTVKYRTAGMPTNNPAPSGITITTNTNATINIRLDWGIYTQGANQADFLMLFWKKGAGAPTVNDACKSFNVNTSAGSYYIFEGVNPADTYSFGLSVARRTENGLEIGAIQSPISAPNWQSVTSGTPNYTGNISGLTAATVVSNAVNGALAWGKFTGVGNSLPSGNVEFNFANSTSKGGNATNTDAIGTQTASNVQNATINFNGRNDRIATAILAPTIAADGTAMSHTISTDGSANISLKWAWTGNNADIDGWIVYVRQSTISGAYVIGTTPDSEKVYYLTPEKRAIVLYGVPANQYYTFGVQAYRIVDPDINTAGAIKSSIVQPSLASENPRQPSATVAFSGDITGTVNGVAAATVTTNAANGNTAYNGTLKYRTPGAPTNQPNPTGLEVITNSNGTINIKLSWGIYTQGANQADSLLLFWRKGTAPLGKPTINDACISFNVNTTGASYYIFEGVSPTDNFAFALAAARRTENGTEVGPIVSSEGYTAAFNRPSPAYLQSGIQVASGVPRYENGYFHNLLTDNQASVETDLTGINPYNCTGQRVTTTAWTGSASLKLTHNNPTYLDARCYSDMLNAKKIAYTGSSYVKGEGSTIGKTFTIYLYEWNGSAFVENHTDIVLTANWQRVSVTRTMLYLLAGGNLAAGACRLEYGWSASSVNSGEIVYVDGLQINEGLLRDWILPSLGKGIMLEEGTTPKLLNGFFATDTNLDGLADNWTAVYGGVGETFSIVNRTGWSGKAQRVEVTGAYTGANVGMSQVFTETAGNSISARMIGKTNKSLVSIILRDETGAVNFKGQSFTVTPGVQFDVSVSSVVPAGCTSVRAYFYTDTNPGTIGDYIEFYAAHVEDKTCSTSVTDVTRAAETLPVPTPGVFTKGSMTVEFIYNPTVNPTASGRWDGLFEIYIDANNNYRILKHSNGRPYAVITSGGVAYDTYHVSDPVMVIGTQYRFGLTLDGTNIKFFINGVKSAKGNVPYVEPVGALPVNAYLGQGNSSSYPNGIYDDLCISSIARTDADMQARGTSTSPLPIDADTTFKLSLDASIANLDWQDITSGTPNYTGNVSGVPADSISKTPATLIVADGSTSLNTKRADYVVPAGATNAQVTINAAINALPGTTHNRKGKIVLLDGTYTIDGSIVCPSNLEIEMSAGTTIKVKNALNVNINVFTNSDQTNGNENIIIKSGNIDGNKANNSAGNQSGIYLYKTTNSRVVRITVKQFRLEAITLDNSSNNSISDNILQYNNGRGINLSYSVGNTIIGNNSSYNLYGIVNGYNSKSNTYTGNVCRENQCNGILVAQYFGDNNIISNNVCVGNWWSGIMVDVYCKYNTLIGNICQGNYWHGIQIEYTQCDHNIVSNNHCTENGQATDNTYSNIFIQGSYITVQTNICRQGGLINKPQYGIRNIGYYCLITNNDLYSAGKTANFSDAGTGTITAAGNRI